MTKTRIALLCGPLLALIVILAAACDGGPPLVGGGDGATSSRTATLAPTSSTTADATPGAITATPEPLPEGIQTIFDKVAALRNLPEPPALKANLIARSDLPALLDSLLTDDDRRWFAQTTTLYRLLGTIANDQDYYTIYQGFGAGSVLGLYSPDDDELWVVHDDGADIDFDHLPREEETTLAHELVHALQDYSFQLDQVYDRLVNNLDRNLAWTAVVEGDAVTHEGKYSKKYLLAPGGAGGPFLLASLPLDTTPPAINRELYFPYTTGADFVAGVVAKDGTKPIDELLANGPSATSLIMHPALRTSGWAPQDVTLPDFSSALGTGWAMESSGTFGEFQLKNFLQDAIGATAATKAADGWAGDHYAVYRDGDASAATFRIRFATPADATEFANALQTLASDTKATVTTDSGVTFARAKDGDVTATVPVSATDVLFAIASDEGTARAAMQALIHG